jgi:hypothetical protein
MGKERVAMAELERVTEAMLTVAAGEIERLEELVSVRGELVLQIAAAGLDAEKAERVKRVIDGGAQLQARVVAMAAALRQELAAAEREARFVREVGGTVSGEAGMVALDIRA